MEESDSMKWIFIGIGIFIALILCFMLWCCIRLGDDDNE